MKKRLRKVLSIALALFTIIGAMPVASLLAPVETQAAAGKVTVSITAAENYVVNFSDNNQGWLGVSFIGDEVNNTPDTHPAFDASDDLPYNAEYAIPDNTASVDIDFGAGGNEVSLISIMIDGVEQCTTDEVRTAVLGNSASFQNVTVASDVQVTIVLGGDNGGQPGPQTFNVDFGANGSWTVNNTNVTASIGGQAVNNVVEGMTADQEITLTGFDPDTMEVRVTEYGGNNPDNPFWTKLTVNNGVTKIANRQNDGGIPNNLVFSVNEKSGGGQGGDQPGPSGPETLVKIAGAATAGGTWSVPEGEDVVVDHWKYQDESHSYYVPVSFDEMYKGRMEDGEYRDGVRVNIINGNETWTDSWYRDYQNQEFGSRYPKADGSGWETQGPRDDRKLSFNINGTKGEGTRKIIVASNWDKQIEKVVVKDSEGHEIGNFGKDQLIDVSDSMLNYMNHFGGQLIFNELTVNATADEEYYVYVDMRPLLVSECRIGNFLWSNDVNCPSPDAYIGNSNIDLLSLEYDGQEFTLEDIENGRCPYVGSYEGSGSVNVETGVSFGEMFVPYQAKVTMSITPDPGYQVKSFNVSGGNFEFNADEVGIVTFTIGRGNFHIGGETIEVTNEVATNATKIGGAKLEDLTAGGDFKYGSAELTINDATPSAAKVSEFTTQASKLDADIVDGKSYLSIDLNQIVYKANGSDDPNKINDQWVDAIHDLGDGYVLVTLTFDADTDVSTVALVHNIGDGDDYELIRPETYDVSKRTATFKIKSFSTFAIAKAHTKTTPVAPSNTSTNSGSSSSSAPAAAAAEVAVPKTAESFPMGLLIVLSIVSLGTMATVVVKRRKM